MDAVEIGRRAAADLHARLVAAGADPFAPYDLAMAGARDRDIDVEATRLGAPILRGGRATFIADDRLILFEDRGSPFDRAFLIAHEIGHAELGDDVSEQQMEPATIDPSRCSEPAPVGVDRVVDYSRRQRREIQMDLFARELLLPREVARRLHVNEGLNGSDIADRLGVPFEVVAQQLLDALLLPTMPDVPVGKGPARTLDPAQHEAATHRGRAFILGAGPGTGKTRTLAARVEGLISEGIDPRRILVLTFSNRAAGELADRIAAGHADAAAAMWIGTFHAFGLDLIRRFGDELGLPADLKMIDRTEAVELLEREFPRLDLTHHRNLYDPTQIIADILTAVSRAKDEVVDAAAYDQLARAMRSAAVSAEGVGDLVRIEAAERAQEVAKVYETYERLKLASRRIDFGDLISLPVKLLEGNETVRSHLQGSYDHVLVDEYQDVNRSSVRLLQALRPDGSNLWAVGDAKQSVYRFRGASSFNMARFATEDFPGAATGRLQTNYRSTSEVVSAFSSFAGTMAVGGQGSGLHAERGPSGQPPEFLTMEDGRGQTAAVAETIEQMRADGYPYRDQAVLCTGNDRLASYARELERLGVPILFLGSLFERSEVRDLLAFVSMLVDRRGTGLVRVACWPGFAMSMEDVAAVLDHLRESDAAPGILAAANVQGISPEGRNSLGRLAAALEGFGEGSQPWTVLARLLLDRSRIAADLSSSTLPADRTQAIAMWQFLNFVRVQPSGQGLPITRLLDRVRRLLRLGDDRDLRQLPAAAQGIDAVRLMTVHGSKGLEFSVVHMPGMNGDTLPRTGSPPACPPPDGMIHGGSGSSLGLLVAERAQEQECLFYVGLSRARDRLFLYAPERKADGKARPPTPYVGRMGAGLRRRRVVPVRLLPAAPEDGVIPLVVDGTVSFTAAQIALYESCARRFFYTHVLQVGGRRTATPYMQMHEAVRTMVEALVMGSEPIADVGDLERRIVLACEAQGMAGHGYLADYHAFALAMLRYFHASRDGWTPEPPMALKLSVGGGEIIVQPDDVLVRPDGRRTMRRVRTGHRSSREHDDVGAAAFMLAAAQAFPAATVELVHLADEAVHTVAFKPAPLETRRGRLESYLAAVTAGSFPPDPSPRTCPGCPAFFICGPTPAGTLAKKFQTGLPGSPRRSD